ncbi:hypothetical protein [Streptomyces sp. NPDC005408]|uniref:hypothetical protein n=1 Tax=Streptomyces sp. NPDC005408 TaxID=3155341 RepID=UPI0033A169DE
MLSTDAADGAPWLSRNFNYRRRGRGRVYTTYVSTTDGGKPGLIRLAGVLGDPFVDA